MTQKEKNQKITASKKWKEYFGIMNSFATPFNLLYDNRVIKNKTFDYGYAMTVFKAQGSSIDNVFVDIKDINKCNDNNTKRQMQYVGLSRTKNKIFFITMIVKITYDQNSEELLQLKKIFQMSNLNFIMMTIIKN